MAMLDAKMKKRLRIAVIVVIAAGAALWAWRSLRPHGLPEGFASSNGRIEATEIDVAAKIAGRIREILVKEGDLIAAGQVLARMDTDVLRAQRREAEARVNEALIAVETAKAEVAQREAEKLAAQAMVEQRAAELYAAEKRFVRSEPPREVAGCDGPASGRRSRPCPGRKGGSERREGAGGGIRRGHRHGSLPDRTGDVERGSRARQHPTHPGGHRRQRAKVAKGWARAVSSRGTR